VRGWAGSSVEGKTFRVVKTRVKDSIKPSASVFRVDGWADRWAEEEGGMGL
jgi:hypothetical protein